jgi:tetratricopeptide (TPR) repeat protein
MGRVWKFWGIVATLSTLGVSAGLDVRSAIAASSQINSASSLNSSLQPPKNKLNLKSISQGRGAYFDRNCELTSASNFDKFQIFDKFEFYSQHNQYWLYAGRYQDGAVQLCLSSKDYQNPKPLSASKIQRHFIQSIIQDTQQEEIFYITLREGNGPGAGVQTYKLNLKNPHSPTITSTKENSHQNYKNQGDRYYENSEYQQAITAYSEAIRLSPRYASLYYNRGISYHLSGSSKDAIADLQKAAQLYQEQGKNNDYRDTLARIREIQPSNHFQPETSLEKKHAQAVLTEESRLRTNGIGPVSVGMTINQAEQASKYKFKETLRSGKCIQYELQEGPKGLWFLANQGQIATVLVGNKQVATLRGVRIGDPEARVKELYRGQLQFAKDHPGSHHLIFIPKDAADRNYRLIFTINSQGKVGGYRAGRLPEVMWQEGCS